MVRFENLQKSFWTRDGPKHVANDINAVFPSGVSVALLGRNGAGKSTLMQMIGGSMKPDSGHIHIKGSMSWPVGFAGSFHPDLSGRQNVRFIARVYGVDTDEIIDFVEDFAELGAHFDLPIRSYSSGMKSRLAFGVSIGIPFDTYLVDEVTSVGDAAFRRKSRLVFGERMRGAGSVVVTHSMGEVRALCSAGAVLENGTLTYFEDVEDAIAHHLANMGTAG
jgi:capsular polysaccharide transport system ATP-binding protein